MLLGPTTTSGPLSQKPWHPVPLSITLSSSPTLLSSSLMASRTSAPPLAWHPVPAQTHTLVVPAYLCGLIASRYSSSSDEEVSLFASGASATSSFWYFLRIRPTLVPVISPKYFPSTTMIGPIAHAPRQLTVSRLNAMSSVVSPGPMPRKRHISSRMPREFLTWQAVPMHTVTMWRPFGTRENDV